MTELRKTVLTDLTNDAAVDADGRLQVKVGEFDPYGEYPAVVTFAHHMAHEGHAFFFSEGITLGVGASQDYMLTTANSTKRCHFLHKITLGLSGTISIYEAGDRTGSAAQTLRNRDRDSLTAAETALHKGTAGGTTDGTLIWGAIFGAAGAAASGGATRADDELILKVNTKYIVRVTSAVASNNIHVNFELYEKAPA